MMSATALTSLAQAIGYPEEVPSGAVSFSFSVDDARIEAVEENGRLVLSSGIAPAGDVDLALFAGYAAGRCLKEEATLAYDPVTDRLILWQDLPATAESALLKRLFEVFAASCDWWRARVSGAETVRTVPDLMIRP